MGGRKRTPNSSGKGVLGGALIGGAVGAGIGGIGAQTQKGRAAAIGGIIGAGLGAVSAWLSNIADQSEFNSSVNERYSSYDFLEDLDYVFNPNQEESEVTTSESETVEVNGRTSTRTTTRKAQIKPKRESEGIRYNIDGDPKKHVVNILFSGSAVLLINKASLREINIIDKVLDDYCRSFKNADYISEKIGKDSYLVNIKLISGHESFVGIELVQHGIKLNVLTGQRFGHKNFSSVPFHIDARDKNGRQVAYPAYRDEDGNIVYKDEEENIRTLNGKIKHKSKEFSFKQFFRRLNRDFKRPTLYNLRKTDPRELPTAELEKITADLKLAKRKNKPLWTHGALPSQRQTNEAADKFHEELQNRWKQNK